MISPDNGERIKGSNPKNRTGVIHYDINCFLIAYLLCRGHVNAAFGCGVYPRQEILFIGT